MFHKFRMIRHLKKRSVLKRVLKDATVYRKQVIAEEDEALKNRAGDR